MDDLAAIWRARMMVARLCALLELPRRRRRARRGWRRSMAAAMSRTPPIRRAAAPRPRRSPPWSRAGERRVLECVVIGPGPEVITPCGGCRQRLREFAAGRPADPSLRSRRRCIAPSPWASCCRCRSARSISDQAMIDVDRRADRARGLRAEGRGRAGLGPGRLRRGGRRPIATIPYAELPGFPPTARRQPCRPAGAGRGRADAGRRAAGPRALLRARPGRRDEAGAIRAMAALGCETLLQTNAAGSLRARHAAGRADGDHRPHQLHRRQSRCSARPGNGRFVDMADAYDPAAAEQRWRRRRRADVVCQRASISGSAARASRRRPRSAPRARWAPMPSACRRCRRRSSPAMPGMKVAAPVADDQLRRRHDRRARSATTRPWRWRGEAAGKVRRLLRRLPRGLLLERHAAAGDHPQEARRRGAERRGDRLRRARHRRRQPERGPGRGLRHGGVLPRHDARRERVALTLGLTRSGVTLDWDDLDLPGPVIDKHSTGGVGDKVSLMLAPIVAACGGFVPMISGRGLGHTGGTLDKLAADLGLRRCSPTSRTFRRVVREVGCAIIGQTDDLAPADRRLYARARRHGDRRIDPADRELDPVQEDRRRARRAGDGREMRLGRLLRHRGDGARAGARAWSRSPTMRACRRRR